VDLGEYERAGLYNPVSPEADQRVELLAHLEEQGCSLAEMVAANARGRLFALSGDRIINPGRDQFSLQDLADRTGADLEVIIKIWRALGFVGAEPDVPVASEADVVAISTAVEISALVGLPAALGVCRVIASSLARVSDAIATAVRGVLPNLSLDVAGSELATAQAFGAVSSYVPRTGQALDAFFRHHIEAARMNWERTDSADLIDSGAIRVGVGFADLAGFTGITENLSMAELTGLLTVFEEVAEDVVRDNFGRVVKFIGDAVMYVTPDAPSAVKVAQGLLEAAEERGMHARAGVAAGEVLALEGDFFGPVVNLAARLAAMADPGEVLITAEVADKLDGALATVSLGPRVVRGFTQTIDVARLAVTSG
jgi:class 3 adenylate cyclase